MRSNLPRKATDLVLVGGGHAHVEVLRAFGQPGEPGLRVTLVTSGLMTPYSGMLPGVVAGLYDACEAHVDLTRLTRATGARLIHGEAAGLDRAAKRVLVRGQDPVGYDIASIDVGITPALGRIDGAAEHGIAVKPIGAFLDKLETLRAACRKPDGPRRIVVIGGGAGGVELMLSLRTRLIADAGGENHFAFTLATSGEILDTHNTRVRAAFRRVFRERGIVLHEQSPVARLAPGVVVLKHGSEIAADATLITTTAAAPPWLAETGLDRDEGGFLAVGPTLQVRNDPDVFGAGDCVTLCASPREKAGVFAVRAGPPLARNLRLRARGETPVPWTPQRKHLALISTGERYAIASRGWLKAEGAWLWRVKDWIDRRWMARYDVRHVIPAEPRAARRERRDP